MMKKSIAEIAAEKAFASPGVQRSWQIHAKAFGPILFPAFAHNAAARIHLTNALNAVSRNDVKKAADLFEQIAPLRQCDADHAAYHYFIGLLYERNGRRAEMLERYQLANSYHHDFYLPYLKVARHAMQKEDYQAAEPLYREAIRCLEKVNAEESTQPLASAWGNLASCLTMLHRYEEAAMACAAARRIMPEFPGLSAVAAVLYAAQGNSDDALKEMENLPQEAQATIRQILAGEHPRFPRPSMPNNPQDDAGR